MKLTKLQLKQIIKEELARTLKEAGGYHVKMVPYGGVKFYDPEGNELELHPSELLEVLETKFPEALFAIVNKAALESHREQSRFPYPDPDWMIDYGFMPGKGYEDLLELYSTLKIVDENKGAKLTKSQLKQIIKEEILKVLNETVFDAIPDVEKFSAEEMVPSLQKRPDLIGTKIYQLNRARYAHPDQAEKIDQALEMLGWTEEAMNHWSRNA